jgi:hypothetical protein
MLPLSRSGLGERTTQFSASAAVAQNVSRDVVVGLNNPSGSHVPVAFVQSRLKSNLGDDKMMDARQLSHRRDATIAPSEQKRICRD